MSRVSLTLVLASSPTWTSSDGKDPGPGTFLVSGHPATSPSHLFVPLADLPKLIEVLQGELEAFRAVERGVLRRLDEDEPAPADLFDHL